MQHTKVYPEGSFTVYNQKPSYKNIIFSTQTHSNIVLTYPHFTRETIGDGIIISYTELQDRLLAVKTADCLPILYLGKTHLALIHAGWRGVENGILINAKLKELEVHSIYIGPAISEEAFEVQDDFCSNFPDSDFFSNHGNKIHFNLIKEATSRIQKAFPHARIDCANICTYSTDGLHSFRENGTDQRNWNIFKLNKDKL